ncbi:MAG: hypothetical protein WCL39_01285 [Armatimonadota bacterium]
MKTQMPCASKVVACAWLLTACWIVGMIAVADWRWQKHLPIISLLAILLLAVPVGASAVAVLQGRISGWWGLVTLSSLGVIGALVLGCYAVYDLYVGSILPVGNPDLPLVGWVITLAVVVGVPTLISLLILIKAKPANLTVSR